MVIDNMIIKKEKYQEHEYLAVYIVVGKQEYFLGTLKELKNGFKYIKCVERRK